MLLCVTFGKIVRKAVIATGGRGFQMTIIGHIGKKFDCLCQISGVYANNAASLFPYAHFFNYAHISFCYSSHIGLNPLPKKEAGLAFILCCFC